MNHPGIDRLLPSVAATLGVPGQRDDIGLSLNAELASVDRVVVLLVDGLGGRALAAHAQHAPTLAAARELGPLRSTFPSTTAAAITSLGTGLLPGEHGIIGSAFELDDGSVLTPLTWADQPNPVLTQPQPTMLETCTAAGLGVYTIAPARFEPSGLTRAALRGGRFLGCESHRDRIAGLAAALAELRAAGQRGLCYVYWPDLDKAGHVHGVASPRWRAELQVSDALAAGLAELLGARDALLVTADHGMVDVADEQRIDLDGDPDLRRGVRRILGEPRVRHVYARPGAAPDVAGAWASVLGERAVVRTREEVLAAGWFGEVDPWFADRIGDVVAVASADYSLVSDRTDRRVSNLRGQHGGFTAEEVEVPLLLLRR